MPKSSSSPSPTITPMNSTALKSQTLTLAPLPVNDDPLLSTYHSYPQSFLIGDADPHPDSILFNDDDGDPDDDYDVAAAPADPSPDPVQPRVDTAPHVSSQFYTFNGDSHALMIRCILESRLATADEIRAATPCSILDSWRSVWKDRNEDTAYVTAWKRIQDKLAVAAVAGGDDAALHFKSNRVQRVSHFGQWHEIVSAAHGDADLRHLGLKETVERIKQHWTVGAKFYGIPESFIRVCVMSCPVCSSSKGSGRHSPGGSGGRNKRQRFEYTESFDVPAGDVQRRLQQLATKHKVVLCIRQKYIRYKPFLAEVKDYACHRAGEPTNSSNTSKKARVLKREPYASKRCGCGFRIRAIVPIANYNDKDKSFVYQEEGTAVFKLYAVHSGHEPGPLDGSARIIHRLVGQKVGFDQEQEIFGVSDDMEVEFDGFSRNDDVNDACIEVLQQVKELRSEVDFLEVKIAKMPREQLGSLSHNLSEILDKLRAVGELEHFEEPLSMDEGEIGHWGSSHDEHPERDNRIFGKDLAIIEEENDFNATLGSIVPWEGIEEDCGERKILLRETCTDYKWFKDDFDDRSILNCGKDEIEEESKIIKPLGLDCGIVADPSIEGIQVAGFYTDNSKWYDSPSVLEHDEDDNHIGFRHERIV